LTAETINLNGGVTTAGGDQSYSGAVTLGATVTLAAGAGNVTFSSTVDGAYTLTVNSSGTTTFNDAVGGGVALVKLTTDAPGTTQLKATIHTTGDVPLNDLVTLAGPVAITDDSTGVFFGKAVSGAFALTVNSPGMTTFNGAVSTASLLTD